LKDPSAEKALPVVSQATSHTNPHCELVLHHLNKSFFFTLHMQSVQVAAFKVPFEVKIFMVEAKKLVGLPE
jgi:hypothetical protein